MRNDLFFNAFGVASLAFVPNTIVLSFIHSPVERF
jgi:hypothetical protein